MTAFELVTRVGWSDPNHSVAAGYRMPEGGPFVPCRVRVTQRRENQDFETNRVLRAGYVIEVRAAELTPALNGLFDFGEPVLGHRLWKVTATPVREDRLKLIWTCAVSPG